MMLKQLIQYFQKATELPAPSDVLNHASNSHVLTAVGGAVPGFSGSFVRFFHGKLPYTPEMSPLPRRSLFGGALSQKNYTDVSLKTSLSDGPIQNRSSRAILEHAPYDSYAFQIFRSETVKSPFLNKTISKETAETAVFWVGEVAAHNGVVTLMTVNEDLVRVQPYDVIISKDGKQIWPERKAPSADNTLDLLPRPSVGGGR